MCSQTSARTQAESWTSRFTPCPVLIVTAATEAALNTSTFARASPSPPPSDPRPRPRPRLLQRAKFPSSQGRSVVDAAHLTLDTIVLGFAHLLHRAIPHIRRGRARHRRRSRRTTRGYARHGRARLIDDAPPHVRPRADGQIHQVRHGREALAASPACTTGGLPRERAGCPPATHASVPRCSTPRRGRPRCESRTRSRMHRGAHTDTHARLHVIRARPRRVTAVLTFARPAARTSSVAMVKCRRSAGATDAGTGSRAGITRAGRTVQTLRVSNHRALLRERGARARLLRGRGYAHDAIASTVDQREEGSSRRYAFASSCERYILLFLARKSVAHWFLSPFDCAVPTCSVFPRSSRITHAKSLASPQRQWTSSS
jgi:hypothetical protein